MHRLELEEGYLNSLDRIIKNLKQFESQRPRNPDLTGSVYRAYMAHVQMSEAQRQPRIQYIQTIKSQLQAFAQLKVNNSGRRSYLLGTAMSHVIIESRNSRTK